MNFNQTLVESFRLLKLLSSGDNLDLEEIGFVTPFLITPLSAYYQSLSKKKEILLPKKSEVKSYLDLISFPQGISITKFKDMKACKSYFPLFCFSNEEISKGEVLNKLTECLDTFADILKNKDLIYHPLDELIDNIREHAFSDICYINAQIYSGKYLCLSIVDIGKTIPQSYRDAGFELEKDSEAFEYILSGISSTRDTTRGYGLNSNIEIISSALNGSITVVSGKAAVSKIQDKKPEIFDLSDHELEFKGTFINILFKMPTKKLDINSYDYIGKKKTYTDNREKK